jgi:hypothetical protein
MFENLTEAEKRELDQLFVRCQREHVNAQRTILAVTQHVTAPMARRCVKATLWDQRAAYVDLSLLRIAISPVLPW